MKLLIVEVPDDDIDYVIGKLDLEACALVHELPTAEQLGRVATCTKRPPAHPHSCACAACETTLGEAILAAIKAK